MILRRINVFFNSSENDRQIPCVYLSAYYICSGQVKDALDICYSAVPLAEQSGDVPQLTEVLVRLSQIHRQLGHSSRALKYVREGCRAAKSAACILVKARALRQYTCCCACIGDYAQSMKLCTEARPILAALGMGDLCNAIYRNLLNLQAQVHHFQTDYVLARDLNILLVGTPGEQRTQEKVSEAFARMNIAGSDIRMGRSNDPSVGQNIEMARCLMAGTSYKLGMAGCDLTLADVAFAKQDTRNAMHLSFVLFALALRVGDLAATPGTP
ncbi:hypothetical protein DFH07DRAFT_967189 [Mycena maculata]|uniref:Uncharacterized protein n=1 Tax=Mycena maculata TaxID=230809 RepID=A0AAD7I584_9AGAR|nr:hypothetical protein DFH07DRAFT_967189 [Mycena maculata]